jgi:hypothetical protein
MSEQEPCQPSIISQCWDGTQTSPTLTANNAGGGTADARQGELQCSNSGGTEPITASHGGFFLNARSDGKADSLLATDYKDPQMICYGLDRASFNQGQNAQYDFSVTEEQAQTLVSRGPGGVLARQSVPYVQEITKE